MNLAGQNRSSRRQSNNQPGAAQGQPAKIIVEAFKWVGDDNSGRFSKYEVRADGNLYQIDGNNATTISEVKKLCRFDFYSISQPRRLLLRVDVIPDDESKIIKKETISILTNVRFFLQSESRNNGQRVPFEVILRKTGSTEAEWSYELKVKEKSIGAGPDLDSILKNTQPIDVNQFANSSGFPQVIGLKPLLPDPNKIDSNKATVSFLPFSSISLGAKGTWKVIKFERTFDPRLAENLGKLEAFSSQVPIKTSVPAGGLHLTQRPHNSIGKDISVSMPSPGPVQQWLVAIEFIDFQTLPKLWSQYVQRYYKSLRNAVGGRPVSFLPEIAPVTDDTKNKWAIAYLLTETRPDRTFVNFEYQYWERLNEKDKTRGDKTSDIAVQVLSLQPRKDGNSQQLVAVSGTLEQLKTHEDAPLKLTSINVVPLKPEEQLRFEEFEGIILPLAMPITSSRGTVRMGAMDLEFGGGSTGDPQPGFRLIPRQDGVSVRINASFFVSNITPGGQDDLPLDDAFPEGSSGFANFDCPLDADERQLGGELCPTPISSPRPAPSLNLTDSELQQIVDTHFLRTKPLVIDIPAVKSGGAGQQPGDAPFVLEVTENANEFRSPTISMTLRSHKLRGNNGQDKTNIVVLDGDPFLIAKVEFSAFSSIGLNDTSVIAQWTNRGLEGSNWQVHSLRQPFDLILPPQGIGEEMEKAKTINEKGQVDFRFSPPARFKLTPSEQPQNFSEVPWNLRRILGYPGQRNPGAGVIHLEFELLYGLSADLNYPFLQLAEISALIGAIPGSLPQQSRWRDADDSSYRDARSEWAKLYRRYQARLAILQPWDTHRLPLLPGSTDKPKDDLIISSSSPSRNLIYRLRPDGDRSGATPTPTTTPTSAQTPTPTPTPTPKMQDIPQEMDNPIYPELREPKEFLKGGATWAVESANIYRVIKSQPEASSSTIANPYFSSLGGWGHIESSFNNNLSKIYADVSLGRTYFYKLERLGRIGVFWNLAKHVIVYERTVAPRKEMQNEQSQLLGRPILRKVEEYIEILEKTRSFPDGRNAENVPLAQRGCVAGCTFDQMRFDVKSSWGTDIGTTGWKVPLMDPDAPAPADEDLPKVFLNLASHNGDKPTTSACLLREPHKLYFYTETTTTSNPDPHEWIQAEGVDFDYVPRAQAAEDFGGGDLKTTTPDDSAEHPGYGPFTFAVAPGTAPIDVVAGRATKPLLAVLENVTVMRASLREAEKAGLPEVANNLQRLRQTISDGYQKIVAAIPEDNLDFNKNRDKIAKLINSSLGDLRNTLKGTGDSLKKLGEIVESAMNSREEELMSSALGQFDKISEDLRKGYDDAITEARRLLKLGKNEKELLHFAAQHAYDGFEDKLKLLRLSSGRLAQFVRAYAVAASQFQTEFNAAVERIKNLPDIPDQITKDNIAKVLNLLDGLWNEGTRLAKPLNQPSSENWIPGLSIVQAEYRKKRDQLIKGVTGKINNGESLTKATLLQLLDGLKDWKDVNDKLESLAPDATAVLEGWIETKLTSLAGSKKKLLESIDNSKESFDVIQAEILGKLSGDLKDTKEALKKNILDVQQQVDRLAKAVNKFIKAEESLLEFNPSSLEDAVKNSVNVDAVRAWIDQHRADLLARADTVIQKHLPSVLKDSANAKLNLAEPGMALQLARAFGQPPIVNNLKFDREKVAYFYSSWESAVGITPALSQVSLPSDLAEALQPVGVKLPTRQVLDRLIPPDLRNFDLSKIFPKFAGLDLSHLFEGLRMPDTGENVHVTHGFDKQSGRAWVETNVNIQVPHTATIFSIGPVVFRLPTARFEATVRIEGGPNQTVQKTVKGSITGNFDLVIADMLLVRFKDTSLTFDDHNGMRFNVSPANVVLPDLLSFVSEFLQAAQGSDSGFSLRLVKPSLTDERAGIEATLNLPIPDTATVTSGIANLILGMSFGLYFKPRFQISVVFGLGRKYAPFTVTGFLLGGAGFIEFTTTYIPETRGIFCDVEIDIAMSGSVAVAVGPIEGGMFVYFGIKNLFHRNMGTGDSNLTMGAFLLFVGKAHILGIVETEISEFFEVRYNNGKLTGHGRLALKIKICWCFTLEVSADLEYTLGEGAKTSTQTSGSLRNSRRSLAHHAMPAAETKPLDYCQLATDYIGLFV